MTNKKPTGKKPTGTKRKNSSNIKKKSQIPTPKSPGNAIIPSDTFHESFPITLEHMDGKDFKRCFFMCKEHCESYIKRYNLKKGSYKLFPTQKKDEKS
jgi:hypothetical protein